MRKFILAFMVLAISSDATACRIKTYDEEKAGTVEETKIIQKMALELFSQSSLVFTARVISLDTKETDSALVIHPKFSEINIIKGKWDRHLKIKKRSDELHTIIISCRESDYFYDTNLSEKRKYLIYSNNGTIQRVNEIIEFTSYLNGEQELNWITE